MTGWNKALMAVIGLAIGVAAPAQAQVGERVAATVNDDPISTFDVRQRIRLMVITRGIQPTEESLPALQAQALRELIEEQLKLQEAARFELEVPDEEVYGELARMAASNNTTLDGLADSLALQGIDMQTLEQQVRADIAWEQLVRGRYGNRVNVTEGEVDTMLIDLKEAATEQQFLLSEICLPATTPDQIAEMQQIGMQMLDQMRRGVPFQALAQQYSACPSAARAGDLGWVRASELKPELGDVVTRLGVGNVSTPMADDGVLKLIAVRQRRDATERGEPSYQVAYAGADASLSAEIARERLTKLSGANPCNGNNLSQDLGEGVGVTVLPMLPRREFSPAFHDVLAGLEIGKASEVVQVDGTWHILHLCEKDDGYGLPTRRAVQSRLRDEELDLLSRRYLRDVEQDSSVVVLLTSDS